MARDGVEEDGGRKRGRDNGSEWGQHDSHGGSGGRGGAGSKRDSYQAKSSRREEPSKETNRGRGDHSAQTSHSEGRPRGGKKQSNVWFYGKVTSVGRGKMVVDYDIFINKKRAEEVSQRFKRVFKEGDEVWVYLTPYRVGMNSDIYKYFCLELEMQDPGTKRSNGARDERQGQDRRPSHDSGKRYSGHQDDRGHPRPHRSDSSRSQGGDAGRGGGDGRHGRSSSSSGTRGIGGADDDTPEIVGLRASRPPPIKCPADGMPVDSRPASAVRTTPTTDPRRAAASPVELGGGGAEEEGEGEKGKEASFTLEKLLALERTPIPPPNYEVFPEVWRGRITTGLASGDLEVSVRHLKGPPGAFLKGLGATLGEPMQIMARMKYTDVEKFLRGEKKDELAICLVLPLAKGECERLETFQDELHSRNRSGYLPVGGELHAMIVPCRCDLHQDVLPGVKFPALLGWEQRKGRSLE